MILNYQLVYHRLFVGENQRKEREATEGRLDRKDYKEGETGLISDRWLRIRPSKNIFCTVPIFKQINCLFHSERTLEHNG